MFEWGKQNDKTVLSRYYLHIDSNINIKQYCYFAVIFACYNDIYKYYINFFGMYCHKLLRLGLSPPTNGKHPSWSKKFSAYWKCLLFSPAEY